MESPTSCDTFVAMADVTAGGCVIFGKNSDRPSGEVQEVVYLPAAKHDTGTKLKVSHEIPPIDRASDRKLYLIVNILYKHNVFPS
jgi:dipeptidase